MKFLLPLVAALLPSLASAAPTPRAVGDHIPVSEVTRIDYTSLQGSPKSGHFARVSSTVWSESNADGHHRFTATGSDEHSIYLTKSDGAKLQLDLWQDKVRLNGRDLYRITGVAGQVTGYNVTRVDYAGSDPSQAGVFVRQDSQRWQEHNQAGQYTFTVERAEARKLHLRKSDGARIELDLAANQVKMNGGYLYRITVARTAPHAHNGSQPAPVAQVRPTAPQVSQPQVSQPVPATAPVTKPAKNKTAKGPRKPKNRGEAKAAPTPTPTYHATDANALRGEYYIVNTGGAQKLRNTSLGYADDKRKRAHLSASSAMKWSFQPVRNKPGVYSILSAKPGPSLGQSLSWKKDDSKLVARVERKSDVEWSVEAVAGKPGHFRILNARSDKRREWFGEGLMWEMHKGVPRVVVRKNAPATEWLITTRLPQ